MAKKILIAGAGIGGLTAASCLMKAGFDVEIYEQAPGLSEIGAGIQLSANAMHVLNHLGLGDAIAKLSVRPGAYVFRLHDTGEIIGQFPLLKTSVSDLPSLLTHEPACIRADFRFSIHVDLHAVLGALLGVHSLHRIVHFVEF